MMPVYTDYRSGRMGLKLNTGKALRRCAAPKLTAFTFEFTKGSKSKREAFL